jgi:hypothetical protein
MDEHAGGGLRGELVVKSPLRVGALAAPKSKVSIKARRPQAGKGRWIASLSAAAAMVVGVGTLSAIFVDYLADRALARAVDSPPPAANPIVAKAVQAEAAAKVAALAPDAAQDGAAVAPPATEVVAALPDPELVKKVAVGPEHAVELPGDDPTASPTLHLDGVAPPEDAFFVDATVSNDEPVTADAEEDGLADGTQTAAIAPDEQPAKKPKRQKTAKTSPSVDQQTKVASLPGVDIGGLAGHQSDENDNSSSTVRTVTKPAKAAVKNLGGVAPGAARVTAAVNLRSSPRKGASVAVVVPAGSAVNVLTCDGWCEVVYNGKKGWVYKSYLSGSKAKPQKAAKAANSPAAPTTAAQPATRKIQSSRL